MATMLLSICNKRVVLCCVFRVFCCALFVVCFVSFVFCLLFCVVCFVFAFCIFCVLHLGFGIWDWSFGFRVLGVPLALRELVGIARPEVARRALRKRHKLTC